MRMCACMCACVCVGIKVKIFNIKKNVYFIEKKNKTETVVIIRIILRILINNIISVFAVVCYIGITSSFIFRIFTGSQQQQHRQHG